MRRRRATRDVLRCGRVPGAGCPYYRFRSRGKSRHRETWGRGLAGQQTGSTPAGKRLTAGLNRNGAIGKVQTVLAPNYVGPVRWPERRRQLPAIRGDEELCRKTWEKVDAYAHTYIWWILEE
jgi:hypothetical protein